MNAVSTPPLGGTRALLQSLAPSLVPSERRVAQVCIDEPQCVAEMSVAELADRAGVSPATVVRACKSLGFGGFLHLRELLIRDAAALSAAEGPSHESQHAVEQMFERAVQGIRGALGALDFSAFDAAAERIRECRRLLIVGNGASLSAAQSAALQFLSSGKACESPVDVVTQHIAATQLRHGDACLAISDSGMNSFTLGPARLAHENGATLIGVTSYAKSELASISDFALVAGADFHRWSDNTVTGNIVQMLLLSALHAASFETSSEEVAARADAIDSVRAVVVRPE